MATLLQDHFTDSNGVLLTAHTMDTGPGWTAGNNNLKISGNAAVGNVSADENWVISDSGQTGVVASCTVTLNNSVASSGGLIIRATDTSHFWLAEVNGPGAGNTLHIYEYQSGFTSRASAGISISDGVAYTLTFEASGNLLTATLTGQGSCNYTSSAMAGGTNCGVHAYSSQTALDDFLVVSGGGGVVTSPLWWERAYDLAGGL